MTSCQLAAMTCAVPNTGRCSKIPHLHISALDCLHGSAWIPHISDKWQQITAKLPQITERRLQIDTFNWSAVQRKFTRYIGAFSSLSYSSVMVRALIHSRLDYCLLSDLPAGQIAGQQGVLWSAARLGLSLPSCAPVSAAMHDTFHWLDFPQRRRRRRSRLAGAGLSLYAHCPWPDVGIRGP